MQEIQLVLTLAEVNRILASLAKEPYQEVYPLVAKIQQQAQVQLESQQAE